MAKCRYPNDFCAHMTLFHGIVYCDSVPCSLKDDLPKSTNRDLLRSMDNEDFAK